MDHFPETKLNIDRQHRLVPDGQTSELISVAIGRFLSTLTLNEAVTFGATASFGSHAVGGTDHQIGADPIEVCLRTESIGAGA